MPKLLGLRCRECGAEYELQATHVCEMCFGPLDAVYDYAALKKVVTRERIESGPKSIWRYRDLLPLEDATPVVTLGEGFTPLVKADRLGAELGLSNLYLKNDSMNPTNSFKDRVVSVAVSWARSQGFETMACASTGNLANAVAAYSARAGLECFVFIPVDLEPAKVVSIGVFDPNLVAVRGNYDEVNRLCSQLLESTPWAFCNINIRPFYAEGSKTLTFETAEQLDWKLPDEIIIPVASGCQFVRHRQAVRELMDRSEEHTSELQSQSNLVCRLLLEKKKIIATTTVADSVTISITRIYSRSFCVSTALLELSATASLSATRGRAMCTSIRPVSALSSS